MTETNWTLVNSALGDRTPAELTALVQALYDLSPANRVFVHQALGLSPPRVDKAVLKPFKDKLSRYLYPDVEDDFLLEQALEVLDEAKRALVVPSAVVELYVYALEVGGDAISGYGQLFDEFYVTLLDVAVLCVETLASSPEVAPGYAARLDAVMRQAFTEGGWYGDSLHEVLGDWGTEGE